MACSRSESSSHVCSPLPAHALSNVRLDTRPLPFPRPISSRLSASGGRSLATMYVLDGPFYFFVVCRTDFEVLPMVQGPGRELTSRFIVQLRRGVCARSHQHALLVDASVPACVGARERACTCSHARSETQCNDCVCQQTKK